MLFRSTPSGEPKAYKCEKNILRFKNSIHLNLNQNLLSLGPMCSSHHPLQLSCFEFLDLRLGNGVIFRERERLFVFPWRKSEKKLKLREKGALFSICNSKIDPTAKNRIRGPIWPNQVKLLERIEKSAQVDDHREHPKRETQIFRLGNSTCA